MNLVVRTSLDAIRFESTRERERRDDDFGHQPKRKRPLVFILFYIILIFREEARNSVATALSIRFLRIGGARDEGEPVARRYIIGPEIGKSV